MSFRDTIKQLHFERYVLFAVIMLFLGAGAGIFAAKKYYESRMNEAISLGAFVFNKLTYTIELKR